ncbi:intraflagellar transport protein 81 homolog isoform X2 [Cephus cinctus]|uniref:Intraflagellar transport protein 81 homolog n=1 Tax=Cephus cinctus TaxID=211228 RepID=A0AAJ7C901_CEPCN|nr:intraflagellar transport protein 81 homolog isoform X2 [Cephus cinctus]
MSEDIKFIVTELNKLFGRNYNLISFDALNSEDLLQILSDVLSEIEQPGGSRIDVRTETPEQSSVRIFSALRILKYQPNSDPVIFRQGLVRGDAEPIYAVLKWLLSNMQLARQRAYLARFLVKVEIPLEHLGDSEMAALYEQYSRLVEEFKMVHKEREAGKKGGEAAAELKADLEAMEKEREVVLGRVEKMKLRAEPALHLLEAARKLRVERDKERELIVQKEQQQDTMVKLQVSLQRAERELQTLKQMGAGLTSQALIQRLSEEVMVQSAVTKERLPSELAAKKAHVKALTTVVKSAHLGPDEIVALRNRLDIAAREVQALAENKAVAGVADKMAPFRQQAAAIAGMKRNALDKLERAEAAMTDLKVKLEEKREEARRLAEEPAPRGDELKRYVARLKTKSALYKRRRAELAGLRAENGVLNRTLLILEAQLAKLKPTDDAMPVRSATVLPDDCTVENAATINAQLSRNISAFRAQLAPLLNELRPLRQKFQELEERYIAAYRSYSSIETSMESSMNNLLNEVNLLRENVKKDTDEIERLRQEIATLKLAQDRIQEEIRHYASPGGGPTLRDELNEMIQVEEKKSKLLKDDEKSLKERAIESENQTQQWNNLIAIFECKLQCAEDSKKRDGVIVRGQGAETLILQ